MNKAFDDSSAEKNSKSCTRADHHKRQNGIKSPLQSGDSCDGINESSVDPGRKQHRATADSRNQIGKAHEDPADAESEEQEWILYWRSRCHGGEAYCMGAMIADGSAADGRHSPRWLLEVFIPDAVTRLFGVYGISEECCHIGFGSA